jgi:hypothetical protein
VVCDVARDGLILVSTKSMARLAIVSEDGIEGRRLVNVIMEGYMASTRDVKARWGLRRMVGFYGADRSEDRWQ